MDTKQQAKPYVEAMAAWLYKRGFRFKNLTLRLDLVNQQDLNRGGDTTNSGRIHGMLRKSTIAVGGMVVRRQVDGMLILKGLSRHVMEGVAIHELGHAWLFLERIDGLPLATEEGFCNLLSYEYHKSFTTAEARYCRTTIEQSPDPVYGDGFRAVHAAVQRRGLQVVLDHLRRFRQLPSV